MKRGKRYLEAAKKVELSKVYTSTEAMKLLKETATSKFDESIELHIRLGVDSRHADQQVRGAVVLPNGTGKKIRVLVFCNDKLKEAATAAGADYAGGDIRLQQEELSAGAWFSKNNLPRLPERMSIARMMLDDWLAK